jgi:hypothetical protein
VVGERTFYTPEGRLRLVLQKRKGKIKNIAGVQDFMKITQGKGEKLLISLSLFRKSLNSGKLNVDL